MLRMHVCFMQVFAMVFMRWYLISVTTVDETHEHFRVVNGGMIACVMCLGCITQCWCLHAFAICCHL
jgi:hypothetical protein